MSLFYPVDHFRKREAGKAPPSEPETPPRHLPPPVSYEATRLSRADRRRLHRLLRRMRTRLKRNYDINSKAIVLAVLLEAGISGGIFYGAFENAELYAASNPVFMLIAPYLSVCVEFTKVPLGLISQTHPSTIKRALAVLGLLAAGVGTAINTTPLLAKLWKPQLAIVQQATTNLAVAEADQASFSKDRQAAKDAAEQAKAVYGESQAARRSSGDFLTKLPPLRCQRESNTQRGTVSKTLAQAQ
jgi:hypothetical protein